ncbi:hypothetical protein MNBD_GAMMA25-900 [hydrothermal vent metagenome]|uniref:TNase-like domain-containing protein n=1 Tax=hydrothermal vent metagenome TaxID=652676 RepID=A0A3B1BVK0_9ZZZZ
MQNIELYSYRAKVRSVYDGDTIRVDVDLGMKTSINNEPIRLYRINAPELRGSDAEKEKGRAARDYLRQRLDGKEIYLKTLKDKRGKYGRYIADIWLEDNGQWININDEIVSAGHAVYKDY